MAFRSEESLDTNIMLRLVLKDVPEQCEEIMDLFMRQMVVYNIADLVITEAVYVLQKTYSRQDIADMIMQVLELPNLQYNRALFERVFPMFLAHSKLSFNDCCLAAYAELDNVRPLWTFDRALAREVDGAELVGER